MVGEAAKSCVIAGRKKARVNVLMAITGGLISRRALLMKHSLLWCRESQRLLSFFKWR